MKIALAFVLLIASIYAAHAFGLGREGVGFGKMGAMSGHGVITPPPSGCAVPTAPNGVLDLSQCSNASYAAIVF